MSDISNGNDVNTNAAEIDDGVVNANTNMYITTNGIIIESVDSRACIVYNPAKRIIEMKSAVKDDPVYFPSKVGSYLVVKDTSI